MAAARRQKRRRVGQRTVTFTGKVVYERKKHPFQLRRIAKIVDGIFTDYNEKDGEINKKGYSPAPTATIFYIFQRMETWLENRNVFYEIFSQHFSADFELMDRLRGTDQFAIAAENFYKKFDEFVKFINIVIGFLKGISPEVLDPVIKLLENVNKLYFWVRENYPIIIEE